jgi:hypothetical protein
MTEENKKEIKVEYTGSYGFINAADQKNVIFFDDEENIGKKELSKSKIKDIKIYTKIIDKKNCITGLEYTIRSLYSGKDVVVTHKVSNEFDDYKHLELISGEYLKEIIIRFPNNAEYITQLGFITNKNNRIIAGEEDGEIKRIDMNEGKNIILGMSGYVGDKLNCIGCSYTSKKEFASSILFKFFFLRHLVKKDEEFKKKWDEKYNELAPEFKMIWRTVNLPDNCFNIIINTCL